MDHELADTVIGMYKGTVDDITLVLRVTNQQECTQYIYKKGKEDFSTQARWEVENNGTLTFWAMVNPFSNEGNSIPTMSDTTAGIVSKDEKTITLIFNNEHQFEVKSIIE